MSEIGSEARPEAGRRAGRIRGDLPNAQYPVR